MKPDLTNQQEVFKKHNTHPEKRKHWQKKEQPQYPKKRKKVKVLLPAHLLHQVLVRLLDAGVGDGFLREADGVNDVSLTALTVATTPAAQRQHTEFSFHMLHLFIIWSCCHRQLLINVKALNRN